MSSVNYGTKRIVTGAHYGARDWLVQRASAVVIIAFTAIILAQLLLARRHQQQLASLLRRPSC